MNSVTGIFNIDYAQIGGSGMDHYFWHDGQLVNLHINKAKFHQLIEKYRLRAI